MSYIEVNITKCNGCGKCTKVCNYDAIKIVGEKASVDLNSCTFCNACINVCKTDAIKIVQATKNTRDVKAKYKGIWVIVEYFNSELKNTSFQLISKAVELSKVSGDEVTIVMVGDKISNEEMLKRIFAEYGVKNIILLINNKLTRFIPEDCSEIVTAEIIESKPKIILILGTIFGRSIAPRIATRIRTGLTADCTDLEIDKDGNLLQIRPTYGGKILAKIKTPYNYPQMASVRPNIFIEKKEPNAGVNEFVIKKKKAKSFIYSEELKKVLKINNNTSEANIPLTEAKIIFCAGFGVNSKEGYKTVKDFAKQCGAAIAATRAVVDMGWADISEQIGQTGIIVRPELYIGFGVSGAIHHIIGMRHSRKIIAVNKDFRAPIFKIADYCIVADLFDFLKKLKSNYKIEGSYKNSLY